VLIGGGGLALGAAIAAGLEPAFLRFIAQHFGCVPARHQASVFT